MIWQLAREQLRSQRRFVAWTAALLTAAIALASYAAISTTTQISNDLHAQRIQGYDDLFLGYADSVSTVVQNPAEELGSPVVPTEVVDAQVQAAIASGSDIQASRNMPLYATAAHAESAFLSIIVAIAGDYAWDDVLVEGRAPESGEIAISRRLADELGVGIGDSIETHREDFGPDFNVPPAKDTVSLTVSGITVTPGTGRNYDVGIPEAIASWDDRLELEVAGNFNSDDASWTQTVFTTASWNSASTDLSAFELEPGVHYASGAGRSDGAGVSIAISVALFLGLIAMSFAVGRSQAQARSTWAATARTMGARRRTVAAATIVETLVIGLAASVVGIVLGWLAVAVDLALIRASAPDAFLPPGPEVMWWVLGLVLLLGVAMSAIVGAVPAFWASRVSPVAALKPVTPLANAEVSRRVTVRAIAIPWAACLAGLWFTGTSDRGDEILTLLSIAFAIGAVVLSFALALEVLRQAMPQLGRRLGRSLRPWAIAAGEALVSRPRQSAIAALIMALAAFGGTALMTYAALDEWLRVADPYMLVTTSNEGLVASAVLGAFTGATTLAILIAIAIFASGARESQADDATRAALGMTTADARIARSLYFGLPLVAGLALGVVAGFITGFMLSLGQSAGGEGVGTGWPFSGLPGTIVPNLALVSVGLVLIAVGAGLVAATTSRRSPVDDLARV